MKQLQQRKNKGKQNWIYLIFALPGVIYLMINNLIPMVIGIVLALKNVNFRLGILGSPWAGLENFKYLFSTEAAWVITRNTILYNLAIIVIGTILAVLVALLLNEVRGKRLFKYYQSTILFPHLISMLIVSYLVYAFLSAQNGFVNRSILAAAGIDPVSWYNEPKYWPFILTFLGCWKTFGYTSLIFYAAVVDIDQDVYDASAIDGVTGIQRAWYITLPMIRSTIAVMVLLALGRIFSADFGLFYQVPMDSGALYSTTNVIDTFVYRALLKTGDISMAAAACLYQSVVGFFVFTAANFIIKKFSPDDALF